MTISAKKVKDLRELTGVGMMDCKKALVEVDGDIDKAIENLRAKQGAKAIKRSGKIAADGVVMAKVTADNTQAAIIEVNSETDFVARDGQFISFSTSLLEKALTLPGVEVDALMAENSSNNEQTFDQVRLEIVAKLGENIQLRRVNSLQGGYFGVYTHGHTMGAVVQLDKNDQELAQDIAMHITALSPQALNESDLDKDLLAKEREIHVEQASNSGKPAEIVEKIISGKMARFVNEVTLLGQKFVKDPDLTVAQLLEKKGAKVISFVRYKLAEGIEKEETDFAAEVAAQLTDLK
jgi:elongation factor Ts